jgi:hypothetical protein
MAGEAAFNKYNNNHIFLAARPFQERTTHPKRDGKSLPLSSHYIMIEQGSISMFRVQALACPCLSNRSSEGQAKA